MFERQQYLSGNYRVTLQHRIVVVVLASLDSLLSKIFLCAIFLRVVFIILFSFVSRYTFALGQTLAFCHLGKFQKRRQSHDTDTNADADILFFYYADTDADTES